MTQEFEHNPMDFNDGREYEADKRLYVTFAKVAVHCEFKSIEAGRPIYEEREMITIITPGSKDSMTADLLDRPEYKHRFRERYERWAAGQDQSQVGTPLSALPWMSTAQIAEFAAVHVRTVEQLVGMQDQLSQRFMGHHQIKQRAQAFLDAAKEAAPAAHLQSELEKRDEQIKTMQGQIAAMLAAKEAPRAAAKV